MNINYPNASYGVSANRLFSLADALFGDRTTSSATSACHEQSWSPAVDISETDTSYLLHAELPGVQGTDVKVVVRENVLTLSGERAPVIVPDGQKVHLAERRTGAFQRRFTLPKDADGERVNAEFKNGLLSISVPKREAEKPKEIEIKLI